MRIEVRKDWGKKKPPSQNRLGGEKVLESAQFLKKSIRAERSLRKTSSERRVA
jgi:hypothetical protein